ncbi:hypothetical protein WH47_02283, partial [Habropoda laboriosa]
KKKISELQCELVSHLGYFLNLVPIDFHIFRSLHNSLDGKNFNNFEAVKSAISSFFNVNLKIC